VHAPDEVIGPEVAVPLGLLVTEAITNAYKHAFPGRDEGRIEVRIERESSTHLILLVTDNGAGYEPAEKESGGLGRSLIDAFVRQLHGELDIRANQGTQVRVKFPSSMHPPSVVKAVSHAS
jgi:two-component sensor histidine kinase